MTLGLRACPWDPLCPWPPSPWVTWATWATVPSEPPSATAGIKQCRDGTAVRPLLRQEARPEGCFIRGLIRSRGRAGGMRAVGGGRGGAQAPPATGAQGGASSPLSPSPAFRSGQLLLCLRALGAVEVRPCPIPSCPRSQGSEPLEGLRANPGLRWRGASGAGARGPPPSQLPAAAWGAPGPVGTRPSGRAQGPRGRARSSPGVRPPPCPRPAPAPQPQQGAPGPQRAWLGPEVRRPPSRLPAAPAVPPAAGTREPGGRSQEAQRGPEPLPVPPPGGLASPGGPEARGLQVRSRSQASVTPKARGE